MPTRGYLGIDAGTQGLTVLFTDESLQVIAVGEARYDMRSGLEAECYEQSPEDWVAALQAAMNELRSRLPGGEALGEVLAIGISGQMHGEVLADAEAQSLGPARLWCDSRNEAEGQELTAAFGVKMPKRATASRWLWTMRNQAEKARRARHLTTPAGWISHVLTGQWILGIGDASGMFPIDPSTLNYDRHLLGKFSSVVGDQPVAPLEKLLPTVRKVGEDGGTLNPAGARLLGLAAGIPVAPAEGDQPAALAGSLIADTGMVSVSFGTSVCANSVGDRPFRGVSRGVDHFCAVDGKPINMVWLRNGTTFMNSVIDMFAGVLGGDRAAGFQAAIPQVLATPPDCGGLLALPFMDDEPGLDVARGGTAMLIGLTADNARPGPVVKAALLSTMFNLKLGSEILDRQGYPRRQLVLSGGLARTPELSQILADVFETPVSLLASAAEGTAWGAALMAKFRHEKIAGSAQSWGDFLSRHAGGDGRRFAPHPAAASAYAAVYRRYKQLVGLQGQLSAAVRG
ncbi:MAG: xylulokinase [Pirellulaceae bacterium]